MRKITTFLLSVFFAVTLHAQFGINVEYTDYEVGNKNSALGWSIQPTFEIPTGDDSEIRLGIGLTGYGTQTRDNKFDKRLRYLTYTYGYYQHFSGEDFPQKITVGFYGFIEQATSDNTTGPPRFAGIGTTAGINFEFATLGFHLRQDLLDTDRFNWSIGVYVPVR